MKLTRNIDTDSISAEEFIFSICSDTPYERYSKEFGVYDEILTISEDSIDFSRLNSGHCPFLKDHNSEEVLGVITKCWIDGNKLKCKVKFSDREEVRGYVNDIRNGIMTNTSIGYSIEKYHFETINGKKTMIVDNFLIYEASLVGIPADNEVGFNRSMKIEENTMKKEDEKEVIENDGQTPVETVEEDVSTTEETGDKVPDQVDEGKDEAARSCGENEEDGEEKEKSIPDTAEDSSSEGDPEETPEHTNDDDEIRSLGELVDQKELAEEFITSKRSLDDFKTEIRNIKNQKNIQKENKTMAKFSLRKSILNAVGKMSDEEAAFERSINEENKRKFNITDADIVLSKNEIRAMFDGTTDAALQGTDYRPDLYAAPIRLANAIDSVGVRKVAVAGKDISFAVATSGLNAGYVDLNGDIPSATMAFTSKTLTPHKEGAFVQCSYQSLLQDDPSCEQIIMDDILKALDVTKDKAFFAGTAANNEPVGLLEISGVNEVSLSGTLDIETAYEFEKKIREAGDASMNLKWVFGTTAYYDWATTPVKATALNEFLVQDGKCIGYPAIISNAIPASGVILGNFDEAIEADFDGISLKIVEDASLSRKQAVEIQAFAANDFCFRRPASFTKGI